MSIDSRDNIISHMNQDHQLSLRDYVVVYGHVEESDLVKKSVKLVDVDTEKFTIAYKSKRSLVEQKLTLSWDNAREPEDVAVKSLKDLKFKFVSMAKYAAAKQGYSHKQIKLVSLPGVSIIMYPIFGLLAVGTYDIEKLRSFMLSQLIFKAIGAKLPASGHNVLQYLEKRIPQIFVLMYAVHALEVLLFTLPKTTKYRVPGFKKFVWCFMNFFEGVAVIDRLKTLIEKEP